MKLDIVDVALAQDQSGEPRVNLGDVNTGAGFAAGVTTWGAGDGFVGVPNGPDGSNQAPQALMVTTGNLRIALAVRDPRFVGKAGQLAEGDRAIVSDCDAALFLDKSANLIELKSTDMSVELNGIGGTAKITKGSASITVSDNGIDAALSGGGSMSLGASSASMTMGLASVTLGSTAAILSFGAGPTQVAIILDATGIHLFAPPPAAVPGTGFTINGVPLQVP